MCRGVIGLKCINMCNLNAPLLLRRVKHLFDSKIYAIGKRLTSENLEQMYDAKKTSINLSTAEKKLEQQYRDSFFFIFRPHNTN